MCAILCPEQALRTLDTPCMKSKQGEMENNWPTIALYPIPNMVIYT